jgi:glycosyltransferase involved in cell wall biosynthesis
MRIGIDISTLLNHGRDIGAGRYIFNLVKSLFTVSIPPASSQGPATFVLTARYVTDDNMSVIEEFKKLITTRHKLELKLFKTTQRNLDSWNRFRFPPIELIGFRADLLHCPDFLIPPTMNKNIVLTIHDLAFIRYPQFNFDWFVKKYTKEVAENARIAKRIIAVSNSTKNDIVDLLGINTEKVDVTHEAVDEFFRKLMESEKKYSLQKKYNISKKFILSVGTIEPRKNFGTLIRAFNMLKKSGPDIQLVIAGRTGWKSEATYEEKEKSPFKKDIIFTGRLADDELVQFYNMAELFVYPSFFEGFGLPVLEAMQCGLPVLASNTSSIPEIISDTLSRTFLVEPTNDRDFSEKIKIILNNSSIRKELSEKSVTNAARFHWDLTAEKTFNTYLKVLKKVEQKHN